ncbi:threonine/serine exporter family protein [Nocardioides sp. CER19]|uniref:threonine/serine ThrE exporter family protein n=1 Tax=Nocardioides sp. CER19 TaxID=3038538 RepID=UPI00244A3AD2|nr:threonine/serine exporter family protein [Nocardioides sp. CER19]MDH2416281.1 threonine/serine exporter family protein [Nocardioides sp. CER19]
MSRAAEGPVTDWVRRTGRRAGIALHRRFSADGVTIEQIAPPPAIPEQLLALLRNLGVAMCEAGDAADRVTVILDDVAHAYAATGVRFFVLPTGVFVSIADGPRSRVDFAPSSNRTLRLDQIDELYRIVDDIRHHQLDVEGAATRLRAMHASRPRFGPVLTVVATAVLTAGLGLMLNPTAVALPAYVVLGLLVGSLRWFAGRHPALEPVLPVVTAGVVTWVCFQFSGLVDSRPLDIVIPALVTFLPGAALTMATIELSGGSMISGASRLVYGLERLLFLSFGIATGVALAGLPGSDETVGHPLGAWAPWVGVLVFAVGQYVASPAPRRSLLWLLVVLYVAYATQTIAGTALGSLGGSLVAAAVVLPAAYAVQARPSGPPVMVTFLPAFWLLVPGALGLQGVTELVGADSAAGLGDFINALMSVAAIAVGVQLGAGWSERVGRTTGVWRGI